MLKNIELRFGKKIIAISRDILIRESEWFMEYLRDSNTGEVFVDTIVDEMDSSIRLSGMIKFFEEIKKYGFYIVRGYEKPDPAREFCIDYFCFAEYYDLVEKFDTKPIDPSIAIERFRGMDEVRIRGNTVFTSNYEKTIRTYCDSILNVEIMSNKVYDPGAVDLFWTFVLWGKTKYPMDVESIYAIYGMIQGVYHERSMVGSRDLQKLRRMLARMCVDMTVGSEKLFVIRYYTEIIEHSHDEYDTLRNIWILVGGVVRHGFPRRTPDSCQRIRSLSKLGLLGTMTAYKVEEIGNDTFHW